MYVCTGPVCRMRKGLDARRRNISEVLEEPWEDGFWDENGRYEKCQCGDIELRSSSGIEICKRAASEFE